MNDDKSDCLTNEILLRRESKLRTAALVKADVFKNKSAQRHFKEGFVRRHYMLQSSRLHLFEHCSQKRKEPLSPYEATECAIHLNAYYLNLCGALDNLAWALQYEYELLIGVTEVERNRTSCGLFKVDFLRSLKSLHPQLECLLNDKKAWIKKLAELRDPAAHRIPIYVPPSVITTKEQIDKFRNIDAKIAEHIHEDCSRPISELYRDAQTVADFMPIMLLSTDEGLLSYSIDKQVRFDHDLYLTVAGAVIEVF